MELGLSEKLRLRYAGMCTVCGIALPAGTDGVYDRALQTIRCVNVHARGSFMPPVWVCGRAADAAISLRSAPLDRIMECG